MIPPNFNGPPFSNIMLLCKNFKSLPIWSYSMFFDNTKLWNRQQHSFITGVQSGLFTEVFFYFGQSFIFLGIRWFRWFCIWRTKWARMLKSIILHKILTKIVYNIRPEDASIAVAFLGTSKISWYGENSTGQKCCYCENNVLGWEFWADKAYMLLF